MKTISVATVRAQDVRPLDVIRIRGTVYYALDAPRPTPLRREWSEARLESQAVKGWVFVYDVDNGDQDPDTAKLANGLSDNFVLFRLAHDLPGNIENDDRFVAIERHQLVEVQVEDTQLQITDEGDARKEEGQ